ncbi:MAG: hypothetical protein KDD82_21160 [Planctomycetes bacterium]|nr:hypothetical protein [Planctomycetota bacterium]
MSDLLRLPHAPGSAEWGYIVRTELGIHGASDLVVRVPTEGGPALEPRLHGALPLLLHEFDRVRHRLETVFPAGVETVTPRLRRLLPRLRTFRHRPNDGEHEFEFEGSRPSSLHLFSRALEKKHVFRLEDLSHFATHGSLILQVLEAFGLDGALHEERILYCPAVDSPFPFKFVLVGHGEEPNQAAYLRLLSRLLRQTETDEGFRARVFRELSRGFQKFGPAAATPQFQEVELRLWRLLSYTAARLRVKAGRLTDAKDPEVAQGFRDELLDVHGALDAILHLPSRLAAFFRHRFELEFSSLAEHALTEIDAIAQRVDCDVAAFDRSIEKIATTVSEFRRLGSRSPLESLEALDRDVRLAYGDQEVPELETGWARTYDKRIFTGAERFDERRFAASSLDDESTVDLKLELSFEGGGSSEEAPIRAADAAPSAQAWGASASEPEPEPEDDEPAPEPDPPAATPRPKGDFMKESSASLEALFGSEDDS